MVPQGMVRPPPSEQADKCINITFAQLRLRVVKVILDQAYSQIQKMFNLESHGNWVKELNLNTGCTNTN